MKRESFGSRLGFLLVSAGCAIGIGNVWRFPYITGQNGGGYFVLFYLICLVVMGIPVLTMELAVGRASRQSAVLGYKALEKPGSKWHIHGWFCLIGCYLLMMYYTTVAGWMASYFGKFLTGVFHSGMSADATSAVFGNLLASPGEMAIWTEIVVVVGFIVCSFGLKKGLERISKFMMLALLALIIVLAVHSLTLSGAAEGMKFYLLPSIDTIRKNGFGSLITDAMNQAFFTLSLGIAAMEIFGSYMSDKHTLTGEAARICALDTFGLSRKKAVAINFILLALLSLPCVFGYNIWSDLHLIGGRDVLDTEDFLVSNLLLPIGSLVYLLFCVSKWGWGFDKYIAEVNKGTGIRLSPKLKPYFRWILPILILIILVQGLI